MRNINQDPLENLFSMIRSNSGQCTNPTTNQFVSSLKTCTINAFAYKNLSNANCEDEAVSTTLLNNLQQFLVGSAFTEQGAVLSGDTYKLSLDRPLFKKNYVGKEGFALGYVTGFVVKKILLENACELCRSALVASNHHECEALGFIGLKEYSQAKSGLIYPSMDIITTVGIGSTLIESVIPKIAHQADLSKHLSTALKDKIDFSWFATHCPIHEQEIKHKTITAICKIFIPWWCKSQNRVKRRSDRLKLAKKLSKLNHL